MLKHLYKSTVNQLVDWSENLMSINKNEDHKQRFLHVQYHYFTMKLCTYSKVKGYAVARDGGTEKSCQDTKRTRSFINFLEIVFPLGSLKLLPDSLSRRNSNSQTRDRSMSRKEGNNESTSRKLCTSHKMPMHKIDQLEAGIYVIHLEISLASFIFNQV